MPLLKVRTHAHLRHFRRAGISFSPEPKIVDVTEDEKKAIEDSTDSLISVEVTKEEAAAFAATRALATTDPESLAADNIRLRQEHAALEQRVADLEAALRGDNFGDGEPRGVKPSIAPGRTGKARSEG